MPPHLARDVTQDVVPVVELDSEHRVGERFSDLALHLDFLFFCHYEPGASATAFEALDLLDVDSLGTLVPGLFFIRHF